MGAVIARDLVQMGLEPILYDIYEDYSLIPDIKSKVMFVEGSILDLLRLSETLRKHGVNVIIHAAALLSRADPQKLLRINTEGTINVLWAANQCEVDRVVFTSSKNVYSSMKGEHAHPFYKPIDEDYPKDEPLNMYGVTKLFGEQVGYQFYKDFGTDFVALRFSTIYGPGRLLKNPDSPMVIPCKMIESAMLRKAFKHPKGRDQKDDYVYLKDVSQGVISACFAKNLIHRVFNIGSGVGSTLSDFAEAIKTVIPDFEADIGPGTDYASIGNFYSIYDISRAKNELGYSPHYCNINDGVADYFDTMKKLNIPPTPCT